MIPRHRSPLVSLTLAALLSGAVAHAAPPCSNTRELLSGARMWEAKGRPDLALSMIEKALSIQTDPQTLYQLGETALRAGMLDRAGRALRKLETRYPDLPETHALRQLVNVYANERDRLEQARILAQAGNLAAAAQLMRQLFPDGPPPGEIALEYYRDIATDAAGRKQAESALASLYDSSGDTAYRLALFNLLRDEGKKYAALRGYESLANSLAVNRQDLQNNWRQTLNSLSDQPGKLPWVRAYLTEFSDDADMSANLAVLERLDEQARRLARDPGIRARTAGIALLDQGKLDLAAQSLQKALSLRPHDAEILGNLGLVRLRQGQDDEALRLFHQASQYDPSSSKWRSLTRTATFWNDLKQADTLLDAHKPDEARAFVVDALRLEPRNPYALNDAATILAQQHKEQDAETLYREVLAQLPDNETALHGLIDLLLKQGKQSEAMQLIAESRKRLPGSSAKLDAIEAGLLREQADTDILAHRDDPAVRKLETAILLTPRDAWLRYDLAGLYGRLGLPELAAQVMTEGVRQAPSDPDMLYATALILTTQQHETEALALLARIPASARSDGMRSLATRGWLTRQIRIADAEHSHNRDNFACALLNDAARRVGVTDETVHQLAEAWFGIDRPLRGLHLFRQFLDHTPAASTELRINYASMLNRAKQDAELEKELSTLQQRPGLTDNERNTLLSLETNLTDRRIEALHSQKQDAAAQKLARSTNLSGFTPPLAAFKARARLFADANDPAAAIRLWQSALKLAPNDTEARLGQIDATIQEEKFLRARSELEQLLKNLPPDDLDTRLSVVRREIHMNEFNDARQLMDELLKRHPNNPDVWIQAGRLERADRQYVAALQDFRHALTLNQPVRSVTTSTPPMLLNLEHAYAKPTLKLSSTLDASALSSKTMAQPASPTPSSINLQLTLSMADALPDNTGNTSGCPQPENAFLAPPTPSMNPAENEIEAIENRRVPRLESGYSTFTEPASPGTSNLIDREIPLVAWWPVSYRGNAFVHVDQIQLDAQPLPVNANPSGSAIDRNNAFLMGKLAAVPSTALPAGWVPQAASGTSIAGGYAGDAFNWDLGLQGIRFPVSNIVGGLYRRWDMGETSYSIDLSRRPITSSLLSYSGARDPATGAVWGGVTSTGITGHAATSFAGLDGFASLGYSLLQGQNTLNNTELSLRTGIDQDIINLPDMRLNLGLTLTEWRYQQNESYYTWGMGGYYSPQSYTSISLPVEWTGYWQKLAWLLRASVSYAQSNESNMDFYPTSAGLQQAAQNNYNNPSHGNWPNGYPAPYYTGGPSSGIGGDLRGQFEYRPTPHWAIGTGFEIQRSLYYTPNYFFGWLRYYFIRNPDPTSFPPEPVKPYSQFY